MAETFGIICFIGCVVDRKGICGTVGSAANGEVFTVLVLMLVTKFQNNWHWRLRGFGECHNDIGAMRLTSVA